MANKTIKTFEMNFATADGKSKKISLRHAKEKTANYVTRTVEEVYKAEA